MEVKMNKTIKKLTILSLILPVFIAKQADAFPGKNALKKAGYAGAALVTAYAGYQAWKAWVSANQPPLPVQVQNQPGFKTAQQLLEEKQIKLIEARVAERATLRQAQEAERARLALANQLDKALENQQKISREAQLKIATLETQDASMHALLIAKAQENQRLQQELGHLAQANVGLLDQLRDQQTSSNVLPVQVVPAAADVPEPIYDLNREYEKVLRTSAIDVGSMINAARKGFDGIDAFLKDNYANNQVLINFGTTYGIIKECQEVMINFNQMLKENNNDFSKPEVTKQAEHALRLLYAACDSINTSLPMFRTKIADKASRNWSEMFKGKDAQVLEEFDSFKLSFEQRLQQLRPIKNDSLTQ